MALKNLVGMKFNRLTVLKFSHKDNKNKRNMWECICDCGNKTVAATAFLINGDVKSCGCLKLELFKIAARKRNTRVWVPIDKGDYLLIPLSLGLYAEIDKNDYDKIKSYSWSVKKTKNGLYAITMPKKSGKKIVMHQLLLNTIGKQDVEVDHKDGNGLNNRRSNIRVGTKSDNMANVMKHLGCTSQYKGVVKVQNNKYAMQFTYNKRKFYKLFNNELDAALYYDDLARKYHGEFACVNFPQQNERGCL